MKAGRKRKEERNKAAYRRFKEAQSSGEHLPYTALALEFGIDVANMHRIISREIEEEKKLSSAL